MRLGLVELGNGLGYGGDVQVVSGFLGIVVLLGHDAVFVKGLGAIPVQLLLLQVGLGVVNVGFLCLLRGNIGGNIGLGGGDGSLLAVNACLLLHVLDGGNDLALFHPFTLFDIEVGDSTHGRGAKVHVVFRLDLTGAAHHRRQILLHNLTGQNLRIPRLLPVDEQGDKSGGHNDSESNQENLFHEYFGLRLSQLQFTQRMPFQFRLEATNWFDCWYPETR